MKTLVLSIILISGILFVGSVLLMSPKGGLGIGIGGMNAGGSEYGSKKSVESSLKKLAYVTGVVFLIAAVAYPYIQA